MSTVCLECPKSALIGILPLTLKLSQDGQIGTTIMGEIYVVSTRLNLMRDTHTHYSISVLLSVQCALNAWVELQHYINISCFPLPILQSTVTTR